MLRFITPTIYIDFFLSEEDSLRQKLCYSKMWHFFWQGPQPATTLHTHGRWACSRDMKYQEKITTVVFAVLVPFTLGKIMYIKVCVEMGRRYWPKECCLLRRQYVVVKRWPLFFSSFLYGEATYLASKTINVMLDSISAQVAVFVS